MVVVVVVDLEVDGLAEEGTEEPNPLAFWPGGSPPPPLVFL